MYKKFEHFILYYSAEVLGVVWWGKGILYPTLNPTQSVSQPKFFFFMYLFHKKI